MKFQQFSFEQIRIDDIDYGYDVVKKASRKVPRSLRTHATLSGREDPVEMPSLGGRHG
jgi:hypothetical protein